MNVLPVINRELRAEARHAFTYWLRVLGAGAALVMAAVFAGRYGLRADGGAALFQPLHGTVQAAIWLLVPLLTADCLSRERREGTLGLLFLTPLRALDIVVAKSLVHGLRAATLLVAVLPVLALPLLMGGVSWHQAASSFLINAGAIDLTLAAGLLASALCKSWVRSLILAYGFAGLFAICYCHGLGALYAQLCPPNGYWGPSSFDWGIELAFGIPTAGAFTARVAATLKASGGMAAISTSALALVACACARLAARDRHELPPHPLLLWLRQRFCTPVFLLGVLRGWMKRSLERNPIGWLERRTWSGRIVIWGWFAVLISIYSLALTDANFFRQSIGAVHVALGWMLLGSIALNAAISFRRERESRVLELLLVSPLSERQIILGRLRGLWGKFLPSMALLLAGWSYLAAAQRHLDDEAAVMLFFAAGFVTLPVIGLYFSLLCRNFLVALLGTALAGMAAPGVAWWFFQHVVTVSPWREEPNFGVVNALVTQAGLAAFLGTRLYHRLVQRRFATDTA